MGRAGRERPGAPPARRKRGTDKRRFARHPFWQSGAGAIVASPFLALLLALTAFGLVIAAGFPAPRVVDVGSAADALYVQSFHDAEREPGGTYRWTGPTSRLVFPGTPANSEWRVTLRLSGMRPAGAAPPAIDILADGRLVGQFQTVAEFRDYTVTIRRQPVAAGNLTIAIRSPTFRPPGDPRALGVQLDAITLAPVGPAGGLPLYLPPPVTSALALLLVGGMAAALGQLGLRRAGALGGAGLAATLLVIASFLFPAGAVRFLPLVTALGGLGFASGMAGISPRARRRSAREVTNRTQTRRWLVTILLGGLIARLGLAPFGSYVYDAETQRRWADRLLHLPLAAFYAGTPSIDHLPGDIWLLWLATHAFALLMPGAALDGLAFLFVLKLVPSLFDVGSGFLVFVTARRLAGDRAALVGAVAWLLNPASLFLTSIWGQWDAVSALLLLGAVRFALGPTPLWGLPLLTYAALIKPQLAAFAPLLVLAALARHLAAESPGRAAWARLAVQGAPALGVALLVVALVPLPFDVALPPLRARWSLLTRALEALSNYRYTSYSAFNAWTTPGMTVPGAAPFKTPDATPWQFGWSYAAWSAVLLLAGYVATLWRYWRARSDVALVWAALAIATTLFVLPTRAHERYLLPAVLLGALAASIAPRARHIYVALTGILFANLYYVYAQFFAPPGLRFDWVYSLPFVYAWSSLAVATLVALLVGGPRWLMAREAKTTTRVIPTLPAVPTAGATTARGGA